MANDPEIGERLERVEEIIEQLDADECSLDEGEVLYDEGHQLLAEVRDTLSGDPGKVTELE
ncbi:MULTISPECIES: exodeoxyribonuclease VII small subunit [Halobacteriaceae]|uniref:Exonuclease VII, small subunit n=1 Tax=Halanaeroarchaeum sulfurireducens TaxID=1604004 RepID=A0A0F7PBY2_9EURY|nr:MULTISPECIES: exodeoxyribonuclease VII small subunit [Halobacteriaceae]AKH98656.1 exonuclease VII, small subunit [Halanaeroarchaeum sulfurireducens]ALG83099.1 exonuclease VII, small subunit [Halanaeroarchaeum sulfurireducens]MDR5657852.1 exodeoxyribonuclease VII small subunit [Halodesulfurarchaeum sp. HSR-GB]